MEAPTSYREAERMARAARERGDEHLDAEVAQRFCPPYDLTSDMLLVAACCPVAPLRRAFPGMRFVSLLGRALLVAWFSATRVGCYHDPSGATHCLGDGLGEVDDAPLYFELTVFLPLWSRAALVPRLVATSQLSVEIAQRYRMPKVLGSGYVRGAGRAQIAGHRVMCRVVDGGRTSRVTAWVFGSGCVVGRLISRLLPRWTWPARFPAGTAIRALILAVPRVRLAYIVAGQLALDAPWFPLSIRLLPLGLSLPDLRMLLPPTE